MANTDALTFGTRLGPYEIQSQLGAGGMGEVYRARDSRLDRTGAIKVLASRLSSSPELKQRMEREARAISSLSHAHICHIYDIGLQDGTDYLVMEFLEGETLAERLRRGALLLSDVLKIGITVAITALGFVAMLVVPALDHRFAWSAVPVWATLAGDVLVAISFLIIFVVYKDNSYASATIEVYPEQRVISTGLYALVRHPMYMGGLFLFVGMCLALGSWWDFFVFLLMVPALIWRIFDGKTA